MYKCNAECALCSMILPIYIYIYTVFFARVYRECKNIKPLKNVIFFFTLYHINIGTLKYVYNMHRYYIL